MTDTEKQNARITFSGRFIYRENSGVARHMHLDYQLMRIVSGKGINITNGESFSVQEGDIILVHPGSSHEFSAVSSDGMKTLEMKFTGESCFLDSYIGSVHGILQDSHSAVCNILSRIILEGQHKAKFYNEMSNVLLRECLIILHRIQHNTDNTPVSTDRTDGQTDAVTSAQENSSAALMTAVDSYIQQHIAVPFSVEQLAEACGYNRDYVYRAVKKQTGMSLAAYINTIRFEKAKKMLEFSELSISETAFNLGFASIQYFSRFFSRMAGISPSEYLNEKRKNIRINY